MTQIQLIRKFATGIVGKKIIIYRSDWELNMQNSIPRLGIPKNLKANDEFDKAFRRNFVRRCPLARGFSNVTFLRLKKRMNLLVILICQAKSPQLIGRLGGYKIPKTAR